MSGFGGAVKLTGESEYRNALKKITQSLKEVSSEMKLVSSSYDKNDKSVQALTAKQNILNTKYEQQKSKLSMLNTAYASMSTQYAQSEQKHKALVDTYNKEQAELERIGKELGTSSDEYQEQKEKVDALEKEVQESTKAQDANERSMSQLRTEMNKAQADINKTETEMGKLDTQLKEAESAEKSMSTESQKLADIISKEEDAVEQLKTAYQDAVLEYGKNSKEAKALGNQIEDLSSDLAENKRKMADAKSEADKLDRSMDDVDGSVAKAGDGFTVLKGTLANLAAKGIQLVVDGLKNIGSGAYEAWEEFDDGLDIIISKTGATGDAADGLEEAYKSVSKEVVGSFDEIGTAIGEVNTRFGSSGKELESLSSKFLKFAKLNGTDVNNSIDKTQSAMAAWNIETKDTGLMLDTLNKAGQDTGVSVDRLSELLVTNAPALQEMGFSASDAAMYLANLEKNGVDTSTTMAGLKKALATASKEGKPMGEAMSEMEESIKGAKTSTEAIQKATELFGSKAGASIAKAVRSGKLSFADLGTSMKDFEGNVEGTFDDTLNAPDKFALAIQGIRTDMAEMAGDLMEKYAPQIESALATIQKVVENLFSAVDKSMDFFVKHGDTVIAVLTALVSGIGTYVAYTTALKVMKEGWMAIAIVEKAVTKAQWLMNAAMTANPIGIIIASVVALVAAFVILWKKSDKFRAFWKKLWKDIKAFVMPIITAISKAFKDAWTSIKKTWEKAAEFFLKIWNGIKAVFAGVTSWFRSVFQSALDSIKSVWTGITSFFSGIWSGIKSTFANVATWFKSKFQKAWDNIKSVWDGVKSFFSGIWKGIKNSFSGVGSWFKEKFQGAWSNIKNAFSGWSSFFSGLWDKIKNTFKGLGTKLGDAIGGSVNAGINKVIGMIERTINKAIGLINGAIGIINKLPGVSVGKVGTLSLPRLYQGGVLKKGQVGLLEGSGAEAVVPLEKNTKWIKKVADDMRSYSFGRNSKSSQAVNALDYADAVKAFQSAMSGMKIVLDDKVAGEFVVKTITKVIYA